MKVSQLGFKNAINFIGWIILGFIHTSSFISYYK